jgi:AcrR family transcriptional regulator
MPPRPNTSETRKNQIIDAAIKVFMQDGIANSRMEQIAETAGLSVGGVYWYFKGKDEVIQEVMHTIFGADLALLKKLITADTTPSTERIINFVEYMVHNISECPVSFLNIIYELYTMAHSHEVIREFLSSYLENFREGLTTLIEQGIARNEFHQTNARSIATIIAGLYDGLYLHLSIDGESAAMSNSFKEGVELIVSSIQSNVISQN